MSQLYASAVRRLQSANQVMIVSHASPDGDALGSTLALGLGLQSLGKQVTMYNSDPVPYSLRFLPSVDKIIHKIPAKGDYDLVVMVDCLQPERISEEFAAWIKKAPVFFIDHHISDHIPEDQSCIDASAAATGHVVYEILTRMSVGITSAIATLIYTTLVMDTGFFRYSNTSAGVFALAKSLVDAGASPSDISQAILEECPREQLHLLRMVLETIEFHFDGQCASLVLTQQMFDEARATPDMAEDFIDYARSVAGVEVAVLLRERSPKRYKVSLRSKKRINVAELASRFDGGGHYHAAGCTVEKPLSETKSEVLSAIESVL